MKRTTKTLSWISKLFLNTFMCWCLTLVLPNGVALVKAETTGLPSINEQHQEFLDSVKTNSNNSNLTDAAQATSAAQDPSATGNGGLVAAPNSDNTNGGKIERGNSLKASAKFLASNLGMLAIGIGAPSLVKYCWDKWSVRVFAVSAGIYVINEIGLINGFNKAIDKEMVAYLERNDADKQADSHEAAAEMTRKAKEAAKKRAMISKVAAAGFLVASGLAIMEQMEVWNMGGACKGIGAFITPPRSDSYYVYQNEFASPLNLLTGEGDQWMHEITGFLAQPAVADYYQYYSYKENSILHKLKIMESVHAQSGNDGDAKIVTDKDGKKEIVVNDSKVKGLTALVGGAAGLAMMSVSNSVIDPIKANVIQSATGRAIGFGVFGGLAMKSAMDSDEAASKLEKRAQEYDKLAHALRNRIDQSIDTQTGMTEQFIDQTVQKVDNGGSGSIANNTVCATGGAASGLSLDSNCSCAAANKCASPQVPDTQGLPSFAGTGLLADSIGSLNGTASNLFAGRTKEATTAGQALSNNAARITKLRDALKKKFNEDRLKEGNKPVDFEKAEAGFARSLEKQVDSAFNNLSPRGQAALNNLGGPFGGGLNTGDGDREEKGDDLADSSDSKNAKVAAVDVNPNAGAGSKKTNDGAVWDFNFDDEAEAAKAEQEAIAAALADQEDENYQVDGDINDDRNKNLFNIITRRYLKSAYPVIFEER